MLTSVRIRNFKSIEDLTLDLGRVNVLIGENGAGKSNILEAIALAGAASANKLDNEFLTSRGIRVTDPTLMRAAFSEEAKAAAIEITVIYDSKQEHSYNINNDDSPYKRWSCTISFEIPPEFNELFKITKLIDEHDDSGSRSLLELFLLNAKERKQTQTWLMSRSGLKDFIIYSPENTSLRLFERPGQIVPLGINGEGLFKLLTVLSADPDRRAFDSIRDGLRLFGWFEDFEVGGESLPGAESLRVKDRFLAAAHGILDQKSVNEGFLFLLFYNALFSTALTPRFFAIDNIDASLNPKLCEHLLIQLARLAKDNDKQVILTTHNPAVLDGLNLDDDEQRLFVISRGPEGGTRTRRIAKPRAAEGTPPVRLSEAFLRGVLGGLPKEF